MNFSKKTTSLDLVDLFEESRENNENKDISECSTDDFKLISSIEAPGEISQIILGPLKKYMGIKLKSQRTLFYSVSDTNLLPLNLEIDEEILDFIFMNSDEKLNLVYLNSTGKLRVVDLQQKIKVFKLTGLQINSLHYIDQHHLFFVTRRISFGVFSLKTMFYRLVPRTGIYFKSEQLQKENHNSNLVFVN
jgi:hypothetical protein